MSLDLIKPDWPAPGNIHAFTTTRGGGHSRGNWHSLNLGLRCGDDIAAVQGNREILERLLPASPQWLRQVHGVRVVTHPAVVGGEVRGDALLTRCGDQVCAVLTADCLPVLFCNDSGNRVAVAHAGWRGLAGGVLEATVATMDEKPENVMTWLGPAIGPLAYQVGDEVRQAFGAKASACFVQTGDRWMFDLYAAARLMLARIGVGRVYGGGFCTYSEADRFFSFRRDGETGRMASMIWMDPVHESAREEAG
jgi:YfiH family protein